MRVNSTDFQNAVGRYLALAQKEDVIITKNGKSVAKLVAYTQPDFFINESTGEYRMVRRISYEEYMDYVSSSDQRYELIDGEVYLLASPSFRHQVIVREVLLQLCNYLGENSPRQALTAPLDVHLHGYATKFSEDPNVVQPDIVVICDPEKVTAHGKYEGIPTLVVEVLSPSTRSKDLVTKLSLYMRSGIAEYWVVDPDNKTVWQYAFTPDRDIHASKMHAHPEALQSSVFPELTLSLAKIFTQ